jgi:hypothetical protein
MCLARLAISCGVGVVGGIAALMVLRVGLFLTGGCVGFLCCVVLLLTPLGPSNLGIQTQR